MNTNNILSEIAKIRGSNTLILDKSNANRYRVVVCENNGSKTAYYFSSPIYDVSGRLLELTYDNRSDISYLRGSNSMIKIDRSIILENDKIVCEVNLPQDNIVQKNINCITYQNVIVYPTTNGLAFVVNLRNGDPYIFRIKVDKPYFDIRYNGKYFALMEEKFIPYLIISGIGGINKKCEVGCPVALSYNAVGDSSFEISIVPQSQEFETVIFELNMYEHKLMQDTTVESKNPKSNNAFGGIAFIGNTGDFGEQWIYSRPDFSKMRDLLYVDIKSIVGFYPTHNNSSVEMLACPVVSRFCSFGSNWNNKKEIANNRIFTESIEGYKKLNCTDMLVRDGRLMTLSQGWVLKKADKGDDFLVVSTGDNCFSPQIFEVNYISQDMSESDKRAKN